MWYVYYYQRVVRAETSGTDEPGTLAGTERWSWKRKALSIFNIQEELEELSSRRVLRGQRDQGWRTKEEDSAASSGMLVAGPGPWLKEDKLMKPSLQRLSGPGDWWFGRDESWLMPSF